MSKEKISAEKFYDKHGGFVIDDKWDAFNFAEAYAQQVTEQLQRERDALIGLLSEAECPNCDGSGIIPVKTTRIGYGTIDAYGNPTPLPVQELEPTPCEWCVRKDSFLTPKP